MNKAQRHTEVEENGGIAPHISILAVNDEWLASCCSPFTPKECAHIWSWSLLEYQKRSGR